VGIVRIGTCSWSDKTMVKAWYPPGIQSSAEARLRYYAERFDTVEADSPFYAIPDRRTTQLWAERTPPGFLFHVKAYGLLTQHHAKPETLPPVLRELPHELDRSGRIGHPSPEMLDATFGMFLDALEPLRAAGKLGGILMQFPPYFTAADPKKKERNLEYLEYARERLEGYRVLVEFRHSSWVEGGLEDGTLEFLADRDMAFVSVDAPQYPGGSTMPPLAAATSDWAYVRLHGRNRETYYGKHESAADRFDYLYTEGELCDWEDKMRGLAAVTQQTFVMFNNCRNDYAPRNAAQMAAILCDVAAPHDGAMPGEAGGPDGRLF
jgi:uncharacterized protein YecE (DUF72 family)